MKPQSKLKPSLSTPKLSKVPSGTTLIPSNKSNAHKFQTSQGQVVISKSKAVLPTLLQSESMMFGTPPVPQQKKITTRPVLKKRQFLEELSESDQSKFIEKNQSVRVVKTRGDQSMSFRVDKNYQTVPQLQIPQQQQPAPQKELSVQQQLEALGFIQWTDSEPDTEKAISVPPSGKQNLETPRIQGLDVMDNKDERLHFLLKMDLFEKEEMALRKQEEQIIAEVESELYDIRKLIRIQSFMRMKRAQIHLRKIKVVKRKQGKLVSDDFKIIKLQRFIKKKLQNIRQREQTKLKVYKQKLKKYPKKEYEMISIIQNEVRRYLYSKRAQKMVSTLQAKGEKTIFLGVLQPIHLAADGKDIFFEQVAANERMFRFRVIINYPNVDQVRFSLRPIDKKLTQLNYEYLMETDDLLTHLGLIDFYVEQVEQMFVENNPKLEALRALQILVRQITHTTNQDGQIRVHFLHDRPSQLAKQLKKFCGYFKELVRIQDHKLIILGLNDFDYQAILDQEPDEVFLPPLPPFQFREDLSKLIMKFVVKIQALFRATLARRRYVMLKQKGKKVVQQFILPAQEKSDYITLVKTQERKTHKQVYYAILHLEKRRTNEIEHQPAVFRHLGHLRVENFFDVFLLDLKNNRLEYSDEGKYWIEKAIEDQKRLSQNITVQKQNESAAIIQKNIRSYLFKRNAEINLEHIRRTHQGRGSTSRDQVIVKRAMIYQEGQSIKAYLTSFVLTTERIESSQNLMLESQMKKRGLIEQQSLTLKTKALEHLYSKDKIQPFCQKLFYYVDISEMITIANKMVEMSRIIKGKQNVLKIDVKPLEDVQGMLMNEQRERTGAQHTVKKDETLSARIKFSREVLRAGFFSDKCTNIQIVTDTEQFRSQLILMPLEEGVQHDKYMERYARVIQRKFRAYLALSFERICSKKHLGSDSEAVKNFVDNFNPTTNLGMPDEREEYEEANTVIYSKDSVVDIESEEERPVVQRQPTLDHRKSFLVITDKIYDGLETISGQQCNLVLTFNPKLMQVIAIATLLQGVGSQTDRSKITSDKRDPAPLKQSKTVIPKSQFLGGTEPNPIFFQSRIVSFIISQLNLDEEVLFFKPNPNLQSDFLKAQIEFEKAEAEKKRLKQETATLNFDLDKRTLQTLEDLGKNVVELAQIDKDGFQLEFLFDITDHQCLITLYNIQDNKIRKIIKFGMKEFNCSYIDVELPQKPKEEIIRFFYSTVKMIQIHLSFEIVFRNEKKSILTNWPEVKPKLQSIMREKFVQRIQGMLQIRKLTQKFKLYKQSKQNQIFLQRFVDQRDSRYVESRFFLIKNQGLLKVMVKELTTMDGGGNIIEHLKKPLYEGELNRRQQLRTRVFHIDLMLVRDQYEIYSVIENLKKAEQIVCQRMSYKQLADLNRTKTLEYYRCLFGPLIQVIHKNLRVRYLGQNMNISLLNINLPFEEVKYVSRKKKQTNHDAAMHLYFTIKAASRLQQIYRRSKEQDWFKQKSQRIKDLKVRRKNLGTFVRRVFKKIGKEYYIVNVYSKGHKRAETLVFTYELIPYQFTRHKQDQREKLRTNEDQPTRPTPAYKRNQMKKINAKQQLMRGTFMWDPSLLLNTGSIPLYEYILQLLYIEGGMVKFQDQAFSHHAPQDLIDPAVETIIAEKKQELVPQDINEQLVHHHEVDAEGKKTVYDIVYTGSSKIRDKNLSSQQQEEADQVKDNTVKIEVNLTNVKKLYPSLNNRKADIMKIIGENLADGIKVDNGGRLLVNSKKISSQFLTVLENNVKKEQQEAPSNFQINFSQSQMQPPHRRLRPTSEKPSKKQVLVKCTTVYCKMKYLIIVYHIERRIQRIMKASKDEVFESFEQVYQIQASNIEIKKEDLKASDIITWELTPEQAQILSQRQVRQEIAQVLSKRLQVLNGKFIYLCFSEKDILAVNINSPTVILFVEKTIAPIQKRFKNKQFVQNYKIYKEMKKDFFSKTGKGLAENVALFEVNNLKDPKKMFIVVCYEDSHRAVNVTAWDLETFYRYEKEIPKNKYIQNYTEAKFECMRALVNFVEYYHDKLKPNGELIFSNPKQEFFAEFFEEEKRKSQSQLSQSQSRINESQRMNPGSQQINKNNDNNILIYDEGTQQSLQVPMQLAQGNQETEGSQIQIKRRQSRSVIKSKLEIEIPKEVKRDLDLPQNPMVSRDQSRRSSHALAQPTIIQ